MTAGSDSCRARKGSERVNRTHVRGRESDGAEEGPSALLRQAQLDVLHPHDTGTAGADVGVFGQLPSPVTRSVCCGKLNVFRA